MEKIGIGLIGYGGIGKIHTLCYKDIGMYYPGQLPAIDLAAVCTSKPETAYIGTMPLERAERSAASRDGCVWKPFSSIREHRFRRRDRF